MKKKYMAPQTESASFMLYANMLAGSGSFNLTNGGLEQDQNDDGGSCAKGNNYWWFEETSTADNGHTSVWDSF